MGQRARIVGDWNAAVSVSADDDKNRIDHRASAVDENSCLFEKYACANQLESSRPSVA